MKKVQNKKLSKKTKLSTRETAGMNFVAMIGSVEMLRHPEFWL